jgi:PAS domain S-box-containing protein
MNVENSGSGTEGKVKLQQNEIKAEDFKALQDAFDRFNTFTYQLRKSYKELQDRVAQVDAELAEKNIQLAKANKELNQKITEVDKLKEFQKNILESVSSGLISVDMMGEITTFNKMAETLTGLMLKDVQGRNINEVFSGENPINMIIQEALKKPDAQPSREISLEKPGNKQLTLNTSTSILCDSAGQQIGVVCTFNDLTHLKNLESEIRRSERLASLGQLAAGVAHEVRNPLTTIRGYVQVLPQEYEDPEYREDCCTTVIGEIDRLTRLTEELLDFATPDKGNYQYYDLNEMLENTFDFLSDQISESELEIKMDLDKSIPMVYVNGHQVRQVLMNIILNAIQASPGNSVIEAGTHSRENMAVTWVRDSGPGISIDQTTKIFDPFFTTRDNGTGLGLSISHSIVSEHGGKIRVESEKGSGATFIIEWPVKSVEGYNG